MAERVKTLVSIQILRAVAALAVVMTHLQFDLAKFGGHPNALPYFTLGGGGVDLFFVISGFVMVYASERLFGSTRGAIVFFIHRLIRIVPLYWLATTFYIALTVLSAYPKDHTPATVLASYLFIPVPRVDGLMQPVVGQGWTLNYEMFFYTLFALVVVAPRRTAVTAVVGTLVFAVVLGRLFAPSQPTLKFWSDPLVLEFAYGVVLGAFYREGFRLPKPFAVALIICGFVLLPVGELMTAPDRLRWLAWGVPAVLVVAGATFGDFSMRQPAWRPLAIVGDASYALYLFHPTPIRAVLLAGRWAGFDWGNILWLYVPVAVLLPVLVAVAIHYAFERPVTIALRRQAISANPTDSKAAVEAEASPTEWKSS